MRVTDIPDQEAEQMQQALKPLLTIVVAVPKGESEDEMSADDTQEDTTEQASQPMAKRMALIKARMTPVTGIES